MQFNGHRIQLFLFTLIAALCSGCVSEQHSEFRGNIARGLRATNNPSVQPYYWEVGWRDPLSADALAEFGVPQGFIVLVYSRQKYEKTKYRLSNDAVSAVYFYEAKIPINGKEFIGKDVTARDQGDGMHRLQGAFDVEKWKSNVNFRIQFAMHSSGPEPWVVNGLLTSYETWEFNPVKFIGQSLGAMGFAHE